MSCHAWTKTLIGTKRQQENQWEVGMCVCALPVCMNGRQSRRSAFRPSRWAPRHSPLAGLDLVGKVRMRTHSRESKPGSREQVHTPHFIEETEPHSRSSKNICDEQGNLLRSHSGVQTARPGLFLAQVRYMCFKWQTFNPLWGSDSGAGSHDCFNTLLSMP